MHSVRAVLSALLVLIFSAQGDDDTGVCRRAVAVHHISSRCMSFGVDLLRLCGNAMPLLPRRRTAQRVDEHANGCQWQKTTTCAEVFSRTTKML
eukprot:34047-Eustigmatos_ZCMA.PRE.1